MGGRKGAHGQRAAAFLHTGWVLREDSIFMQPQFIIDVIKHVIRESRGENVNDELRTIDVQIRGTTLKDE